MTLANSDSSFKPFKYITGAHDGVGALVVERFNSVNQFPDGVLLRYLPERISVNLVVCVPR